MVDTTTAQTTATAVTFTIKASVLADVLANVLPHADNSPHMPVLSAVQVDMREDALTFAATDRHSLGWQDVDKDDVTLGEARGSFLIQRSDVPAVIKLARETAKNRSSLGHVMVTLADGRVTVSTEGASLTFLALDGEFPKWRSLVPSSEPTDIGIITLGVKDLVKFGKLQVNGKTMATAGLTCRFHGARKPVVVTVLGLDGFQALVMPFRTAA